MFIHNSKAMEDIQRTDERTRKPTLLKTTSIITVSWRICISVCFVFEHTQCRMQNAIYAQCATRRERTTRESTLRCFLGKRLLKMCCFHMPVRNGGGVKSCQVGLEHFFPTFAWECKGLPGWFGALFSMFARLTRGGRGS